MSGIIEGSIMGVIKGGIRLAYSSFRGIEGLTGFRV